MVLRQLASYLIELRSLFYALSTTEEILFGASI